MTRTVQPSASCESKDRTTTTDAPAPPARSKTCRAGAATATIGSAAIVAALMFAGRVGKK